MGFKGADCTLSCIAAMDMWGYKLVLHLPFFGHQGLVFGTCFIIKDLEIDMMVALFEALYDGIICI